MYNNTRKLNHNKKLEFANAIAENYLLTQIIKTPPKLKKTNKFQKTVNYKFKFSRTPTKYIKIKPCKKLVFQISRVKINHYAAYRPFL